ncbi:GumC family protein [Labilibacter marinus]|uniref:GumC family protein n=1 Tax=Labilibacter marinus TaxID=1477105 RepID=UPI0008367011|nr:polysaccharide biosynthesis tyrosine autokinase [Labilibacter marinus]
MTNSNMNESNILDVKTLVALIAKNWFLIFCFVGVSVSLAFIYNKYSPKVYEVSTTVVIHEDTKGLGNASAQLLQDIGIMSSTKSLANEMVALKSGPLISRALEKIDFEISYYEHDFFKRKELYKSSPFIVIIDKKFPQPIGEDFYVEILSKDSCRVNAESDEVSIYSFITKDIVQRISQIEFDQHMAYDTYLYSDQMKFKLILNSSVDVSELIGKKYSFRINTTYSLIREYKRRIEVLPPDLESTLAEVKILTATPEKEIDFLNSLTSSYINLELEKKRLSSQKTIQYINTQLNIVGDSLERAEYNLQAFRSRNELTNITMQSNQIIEEMRDLENEEAKLKVSQKYYEYVNEYFEENQEYDELIAPSAMGIDDPMLNNLIEELIRLNSERINFIENNQSKSPYLRKINIRFENLRKMVSENIAYYRQNNLIALEDVSARIEKLSREMKKMPSTQRMLVGIEREFNINDAIYTYLLEKRAEAEIAKASYGADTEVVEPADLQGGAKSPKKKLNYIIAVFLGLVIPISFLRIEQLLRRTYTSASELDHVVQLPKIGKIYHNNKKVENIVDEYPKSIVVESFRGIRARLRFMLKDEGCKTISINSTISGEGKSFVALNTSFVFASAGYKTIVLRFDLRKEVDGLYSNNNGKGLTEFLSNQVSVEDIIHQTDNKNLDIIFPGSLSPNPAELIASIRTGELFEYLKQKYDYIVVDTPPLGIVSDSYIFMDYIDICMFVVRLKKTPKNEFLEVQNELLRRKVKSCIIYNDVPIKKFDKYGHEYYNENSI